MEEFAVAREHAHLGKNAVVECAMALPTLSAAMEKSAHLGKNAAAQQNRVICVMIPKIMHAKTCIKQETGCAGVLSPHVDIGSSESPWLILLVNGQST